MLEHFHFALAVMGKDVFLPQGAQVELLSHKRGFSVHCVFEYLLCHFYLHSENYQRSTDCVNRRVSQFSSDSICVTKEVQISTSVLS